MKTDKTLLTNSWGTNKYKAKSFEETDCTIVENDKYCSINFQSIDRKDFFDENQSRQNFAYKLLGDQQT